MAAELILHHYNFSNYSEKSAWSLGSKGCPGGRSTFRRSCPNMIRHSIGKEEMMPTFRTEDGAELYYKVEGNERGNPPQIFIHGWYSNLTHWEQQVRYFQDSHHILRMDRRGMGKSTFRPRLAPMPCGVLIDALSAFTMSTSYCPNTA
jgi:hypothetical protein